MSELTEEETARLIQIYIKYTNEIAKSYQNLIDSQVKFTQALRDLSEVFKEMKKAEEES